MEDRGQEVIQPSEPLAGPEMPRDNGLSALGLIMQLGGSLWLGIMLFMAFGAMVAGGRAPFAGMLLVIAVTGAVRSGLHRAAGSNILYGAFGQSPLRLTYIYIVAALAHSTLVIGILSAKLHMPGKLLLTLALPMLAWPLTLLVLLQTKRFSRFRDEIPTPEDRGYEGTGVLMLVLGAMGALYTAILLFVMMKAGGGKLLDSMEGMLIFLVMIALLVRSLIHANTGLVAVRGASVSDISHRAYQYTGWGVGTAIAAGGVIFIIMMSKDANGAGFAFLGGIVYLLLAWPLILRRFFAERDFADLVDESQPPPSRAPDAGMTALGFLLLALGVQALAAAVPGALFGLDSIVGGRGMRMGGGELAAMFMNGDLAKITGRSQWISVGIGVVQIWAAIELITMSPRWKLASVVYGVSATIVTLYVAMPILEKMGHLFGRTFGGGIGGIVVFAQVAVALILPIITIVLANRQRLDTAHPRVHLRRDRD